MNSKKSVTHTGNILTLVIITLLVLAGNLTFADDTKISVLVSILPQEYFVDKIGGDMVDITVLIQPGHSPATFEITPKQMGHLSKSDVYFRVGVPFETAFLDKMKTVAPDVSIVDTRHMIPLRHIESHHHGDHVCSAGSDHGHGNDPHIWLDPNLVRIQAKTVCEALSNLAPQHASTFKSNLSEFNQELELLDTQIRQKLASIKQRTLLVFHPSWGYYADAYNLTQKAIEIEGKSPSPRQLAELMKELKPINVGVIFVQPQFSKKTAKAVAKFLGYDVITIDPLAKNYTKNLLQVTDTIAKALSK